MAASSRGVRAGEAFVELGANDKVTAALKRIERRFKSFGSTVRNIGLGMAAMGTAAAAGLTLALRPFVKFDDTMRTVGAVTRATTADFTMMREEAKRLGRTTSFTANEVAGAMLELGRAGFKPAEVMASTEAVLNLARATAHDLPRAANIAAAMLRQFNLDAGQMGRVVDVLAFATNNSAQTIEDNFEAMKVLAPLAVEAGESLESVAAMAALMADNGIRGSLAGNMIGRAFKNLSMSRVRDEMKALGVEVADQAGNMRPMIDILADLADITTGLGTADRLEIFESIFGRGTAGALKLAGAPERVRDFAASLREVTGYAEQVAKKMDSGIGGAIRRLQSAIEGVQIALGDALEGELGRWMDRLAGVADWLTRVVMLNGDLARGSMRVVAIVAAVGFGLLAVGGAALLVGVGVAGLVKLLAVVPVVLGAIMSPAGAAVAAALAITAALAAGGIALARYTVLGQTVTQHLGAAFTALSAMAQKAFAAMGAALARGDIKAAADVLWASLKVAWTAGVHVLESLMRGIAARIIKIWHELKAAVATIWVGMSTGFVNVWDSTVDWFAARMLEVAGMVDSSLDVEAAKKSLRDEGEARRAGRRQEAQDELIAIEKDLQEKNRLIDEAQQALQDSADAELAVAVADWMKFLDEVQAGPAGADLPGAIPEVDLMEMAAAIGEGVAEASEESITSRGTFNARALQALRGGVTKVDEQIAAATKATATNTRDIARRLNTQIVAFE